MPIEAKLEDEPLKKEKNTIGDYIKIGNTSAKEQEDYLAQIYPHQNLNYWQRNKYTITSIAAGYATLVAFYLMPINWYALPVIGTLMPVFKTYLKYLRLPALISRSLYVGMFKKPIGQLVPSFLSIFLKPIKYVREKIKSYLFTPSKLSAYSYD